MQQKNKTENKYKWKEANVERQQQSIYMTLKIMWEKTNRTAWTRFRMEHNMTLPPHLNLEVTAHK